MVSLSLICRYPLFATLSGMQQQALANLAEEQHRQAGESLFHEGEGADWLYLLLDGRVTLYHTTRGEDGSTARLSTAMYQIMEGGTALPMLEGQSDLFRKYRVGEIGPVEIVGISVIIPPHRFTATAVTTCPSHVLRLNGTALRAEGQDDPRLGYQLMYLAATTAMRRLHSTRQQLALQPQLA
jgi:CRP-like cAMP-binding protein